jgi:hypothetical protein
VELDTDNGFALVMPYPVAVIFVFVLIEGAVLRSGNEYARSNHIAQATRVGFSKGAIWNGYIPSLPWAVLAQLWLGSLHLETLTPDVCNRQP